MDLNLLGNHLLHSDKYSLYGANHHWLCLQTVEMKYNKMCVVKIKRIEFFVYSHNTRAIAVMLNRIVAITIVFIVISNVIIVTDNFESVQCLLFRSNKLTANYRICYSSFIRYRFAELKPVASSIRRTWKD